MIYVLIIYTISLLISTIYWIVLFIKISLTKTSTSYSNLDKTSILISVKNEAKNLSKNLTSILTQTLENKEIIIVDDFSTDNSLDIIKNFQKQYSSLRYIHAKKDRPGKKWALTEAISVSNNDTILLTDADCNAHSDSWAAIMSSKLGKGKEIVLGFGPYIKKNGLLNSFIRYETILIAIQYFSFALYGKAYMAVGRNLAFLKKRFYDVDGYKNHDHVASGDDDLFIKEAATKSNVAIALEPNSFIYSDPASNIGNYIRQKKRHLTTANHYNFKIKLLLSIQPFFFILFVTLSIYLLFSGYGLYIVLTMFIRWLILVICAISPFRKLDGKDLIYYIPILDLCWIPYYLIFTLPSFLSKSNSWS